MNIFLCFQAASASETYSGYIVYDEELIGFFPCGGAKPAGLSDGKIDIPKIYKSHKSYLREPLYFEFLAIRSDVGIFGYGPTSEPVDLNLEVTKIRKIQRHSEITCGARVPREIKIETLYENP